MTVLYQRWMENWEARLCFRSNDRVVRPFEWGIDWTQDWPTTGKVTHNGHGPEEYLREVNRAALDSSDHFFDYEVPTDFQLDGERLSFTSPVRTPYPENNTVAAHWFEAKQKPNAKNTKKKAVIVLPHWNSHAAQHVGLCKGIRMLGLSALRLSLPYHDSRMPPELSRADYAVSSNIGRTIDATRQAVIDVRCAVDWLQSQGYERIGIVGTSLGSCYAFLASAHDPRIQVNVFNHCSSYFADVVWTGLSTQHIRKGLEGQINLDSLRELWASVSPVYYMRQFARHTDKKSKFIYATYDTTFLPKYSKDVIQMIGDHGIDHSVAVLPCGHYTVGETPFKFIDGYHICSFLKRWL
jgi:hypothetical protein